MSIKKAAIITFITKYSSVLINLIISGVLARILSPEDFGIISIIMVFVTLFSIIGDIGFGSAIIQNKKLEQTDINVIFSFSVYLSIVLGSVFIMFSILISIFYKNSILRPLGYLLSVSLVFNIVNIVPNAIMMKNKKFLKVGIRTIIVGSITGIITILLALNGFKYYALAIQAIIQAIFLFLWNYVNSKLKFQFEIYWASIKKIKDFSLYLFAFNIINYLARNLDSLLIGKYMGNAALGYYDKAYRIMLYPIQNLTYVINPILHPILSDYQSNTNYIYIKYIKLLKILSNIGIYVAVFSFFASEEIVLIIFGKQWVDSIFCFSILSMSIWFQITASTAGAIYASLGNTKLSFKSALIFVPIQILLFIVAIPLKKISLIALAATIGLIAKFFVEFYMLINKGFKYSLKSFFGIFIPDIFIFLICATGMKVSGFITFDNLFYSFVYKLSVCTILFVVMLLITKEYKNFTVLVTKKSIS